MNNVIPSSSVVSDWPERPIIPVQSGQIEFIRDDSTHCLPTFNEDWDLLGEKPMGELDRHTICIRVPPRLGHDYSFQAQGAITNKISNNIAKWVKKSGRCMLRYRYEDRTAAWKIYHLAEAFISKGRIYAE